MLGKVQPGERIVTLEVHGKPWSTEQLAAEIERWRLDARNVNLMVGGPEGLAPEVCARSEQRWSLSPLTLPHPLVRSEEHTSELQSLMRISYAVFCLNKKNKTSRHRKNNKLYYK